jgi:hypothetical protein
MRSNWFMPAGRENVQWSRSDARRPCYRKIGKNVLGFARARPRSQEDNRGGEPLIAVFSVSVSVQSGSLTSTAFARRDQCPAAIAWHWL